MRSRFMLGQLDGVRCWARLMHEPAAVEMTTAVGGGNGWRGCAMSLLVRMSFRPRRGGRMLVFSVDRPRRIDRVIDYFGDRLSP